MRIPAVNHLRLCNDWEGLRLCNVCPTCFRTNLVRMAIERGQQTDQSKSMVVHFVFYIDCISNSQFVKFVEQYASSIVNT